MLICTIRTAKWFVMIVVAACCSAVCVVLPLCLSNAGRFVVTPGRVHAMCRGLRVVAYPYRGKINLGCSMCEACLN